MDVLSFQEALEKLQSRAAAEHGIVTSREGREAFDGIDLSDDQLMRVLAYLKVKGITKADIPAILQTGITGIALSGTVLRADDPIVEMNHIINIINHE